MSTLNFTLIENKLCRWCWAADQTGTVSSVGAARPIKWKYCGVSWGSWCLNATVKPKNFHTWISQSAEPLIPLGWDTFFIHTNVDGRLQNRCTYWAESFSQQWKLLWQYYNHHLRVCLLSPLSTAHIEKKTKKKTVRPQNSAAIKHILLVWIAVDKPPNVS